MAIVEADIEFRLSVPSASAGDADAQADPDASLGKYMSTTVLEDATSGNLFDDISGDENAASTVDYRCFFVTNTHATLTWLSPKVWISSEVAGGASVAIGLDTTAASDHDETDAQALTVADESTAPTGVSFSSPTTKSTGLSLGDLAPGKCRAIWVKRTAANTTAKDDDGATIEVSGDTTE